MRRHPFITGFVFILILGIVFLAGMWAVRKGGGMPPGVLGGGDKVAVIDIEGVIAKSREVIDKLKSYRDNERIKAIVIRIDSPGGGVGPAQEIYEEVLKTREKKSVVASMGSVAASGGYYIAAATHKIFANPGTITGSIGVIIEFANIQDLLDKIGLKSVVLKSGRYKDTLSPTRSLETDERALIQGVIDNIHGQFVDAVARGRDLPREQVASIADGRILSGEQAQALGLVDELGNLEDAIEFAGKLAGIEGRPKVVYPEKKRPSIWEFIIEESAASIKDVLLKDGSKAWFMLSPGS